MNEILERLPITVANGDIHIAEDDAVALNFSDFALLHDKRAMHPDEAR